MMKRYLSILICILLISMFPTAYASDGNGMQIPADGVIEDAQSLSGGNRMQILDYRVAEDALEVVMYAQTENPISKDALSLSINHTEIPVSDFSPYGSEDGGTSWIAVLEPSLWTSSKTTVRALLENLVSEFGANDRMAIYNSRTGEQTEFLNSSGSIMPAVDAAIAEKNGDIMLYDAIRDALSTFKTNPDLSSRKCLLIVSKGVDRGSSYTLREAYDAVKELPITVYAVGMVGKDTSLRNGFKDLGSIGRATDSGLSLTADDYTTEAANTVARQIRRNEKNVSILSVAFDDIPRSALKPDVPLTVTLQQPGVKLEAEIPQIDGTKISDILKKIKGEECEHVWKDATCTKPKTCEICGETEGDPLGHDFSKPTLFKEGKCSRCDETIPSGIEKFGGQLQENPILTGMFVLLLILVVAVIAVAVKKWKEKKEEERKKRIIIEEGDGTKPVIPKLTVELTDKETGKKYTGGICDASIKAGLQSELTLEGDPTISREHAEFIWQNGILYVQDINSKNGTRVNGKKIERATPLNHNDIIRMGETNFIVNWYTNT